MNQKKMLETKDNVMEMKKAFDWLSNTKKIISQKRMNKLEEVSIEIFIIEIQKEKIWKRISKKYGTIIKSILKTHRYNESTIRRKSKKQNLK